LIMQLTMHVQVHLDIPEIVKTHIIEIYKHTNLHTICELLMLNTFISSSYTHTK
jgi:hypothetical protein